MVRPAICNGVKRRSCWSGRPFCCRRRFTEDSFNGVRNQQQLEALAASVSNRTLDLVQSTFSQHNDASNLGRSFDTPPPYTTNVFCNRELDLGSISAIGFDYDYTLATYKTALQHLIYDEAKHYLLYKAGYPEQLADLAFEKDFAVRGLIFDRLTGMLLKLSFFHRVTPGFAFLGRQRVSTEELMRVYGGNLHLSSDYMKDHCVWVNDLFSLSEACLLADVVQLALDVGINFDPYALQQDVQRAISHVHVSGIMHGTVAEDPTRYLHENIHLKPLLEKWQDKQLFLLTNSAFPFVNAGMRYLIGDDWRDYFDIVITNARKPAFFRGNAPFRCLDSSRPEASFAMWHSVTQADMEHVLVGGNVSRLSELAGWGLMTNVLYFGDHLHADLVQPKKMRGWYTGAIIRELEHEFQVQQSDEYVQKMALAWRMRSLLREVQQVGEDHHRDDDEEREFSNEALEELLDALELARTNVYSDIGRLLNRHFGSIFRAHGDPSAYGFALYRNSDIYTTRVENFLHYPPRHRFYPSVAEHLPHETGFLDEFASFKFG